jgi:glycogen debranching enzyme
MSQFRKDRRRPCAIAWLLLVFLPIVEPTALAQTTAAKLGQLPWSTDSTGPVRFISAHGRRAAVFGYSQDGLEAWAYPFQLFTGYKVNFRPQGATTEIDGNAVLRRIEYRPDAITRIYAGPDFVVHETIFVPLDEPGAIIRYDIASARLVDIVVRFNPVLDLMWPGGIGGQETLWNSSASAYLISEPAHRFSGSIGSPDIVAHDETPNENRRLGREAGVAFTVRAGGDHASARVIITGGRERSATSIAAKLLLQEESLRKLSAAHYSELLDSVLQIETPDETVNRALAWSEIALDQAWVCNPDLGCGLVAGYGPSRKARRPQYDWFFAGDGMVDIPALLAAGEYTRARGELEFILKYQDQKSGMIWHELSQSAGWIDWNKYPYMFVHVELTFDFLSAAAEYFSTTGDLDFIKSHWPAIQSAYEYCRSLIDVQEGLPHIPTGREGSREQEPLSEELALSANWIAATRAYSVLSAATTGHADATGEAAAASRRGAELIRKKYWDEKQNFWITGYTRSGTALIDRQIGPVDILERGLFSDTQRDSILQQLASSDYETDWGTRGRAASSNSYQPNSYANGSVWAVSTASVASAFWSAHRPATAFPVWNALVPWSSLDSLGHMHETLAGDYYREETESVPEQTWSSARFFASAVTGLLGLEVDGASNRITFAPHLPANWNAITVRNVHVGASRINFKQKTSLDELQLEIHNDGVPVKMTFDPEIPLGAKLRGARWQDRKIPATLEAHTQDTHARMEIDVPYGDSLLTLGYIGGVEIWPENPHVEIGNRSTGIKITAMSLEGETYAVAFDYVPSAAASLNIRTPWVVRNVQGAGVEKAEKNLYRLKLNVASEDQSNKSYQHGAVKVTFGSEH